MTTLLPIKTQESRKGYWTDDEPRGLSLRVIDEDDDDECIVIELSSEYWYRVQRFRVQQCTVADAWRLIGTIMKDCGRSLVAQQTEVEVVEMYRIPHLNAKQVDQLYYLIKHSLTTTGHPFSISHSFQFNSALKTTVLPAKRKRRRKRATKNAATWQTVE